jgi:hypothetical protein
MNFQIELTNNFMFQSNNEAGMEKRRKSFIPKLTLMSPRTNTPKEDFLSPKLSPKETNKKHHSLKLNLTDALQREDIPIGSEITILTEEELNLFKSLNIFRSKKVMPITTQSTLEVKQDSFQSDSNFLKLFQEEFLSELLIENKNDLILLRIQHLKKLS